MDTSQALTIAQDASPYVALPIVINLLLGAFKRLSPSLYAIVKDYLAPISVVAASVVYFFTGDMALFAAITSNVATYETYKVYKSTKS